MTFALAMPRKFYLTYALIAANILVYVYTSVVGGDFIVTADEPILMFGQVNLFVFQGAYWQLFTAMFVHANIVHIASNMFFLLIFGLRAEDLFKAKEYLLIYLLSGLAGNILSLLFGPYAAPSVGASGAIFGVFGACTIYIRRAIGQPITSALIYAFFFFFISSFVPGVNFLAHLGGLAAGLLIGYALATRRRAQIRHEFTYTYPKQNWS